MYKCVFHFCKLLFFVRRSGKWLATSSRLRSSASGKHFINGPNFPLGRKYSNIYGFMQETTRNRRIFSRKWLSFVIHIFIGVVVFSCIHQNTWESVVNVCMLCNLRTWLNIRIRSKFLFDGQCNFVYVCKNFVFFFFFLFIGVSLKWVYVDTDFDD